LLPEDQLLFKKSIRPKKLIIQEEEGEEEEKVINLNHLPVSLKPLPMPSSVKAEDRVIKKELPKITDLELQST